MKYYCLDCESLFDKPRTYFETHGLDEPPYEKFSSCPNCGSNNYVREKHCFVCQGYINDDCYFVKGSGFVCDVCCEKIKIEDLMKDS